MILIVVVGYGEMSVSQKTRTSPIVFVLDISKVNLTTSYTFLSCVKLFPVWTKSLKCTVPITHLQEQNQELTELVPLELNKQIIERNLSSNSSF